VAGKRALAGSGNAETKSRQRRSARRRRKPGNPGFSGYEYQVEVSVWVTLDLILAKGATDEIEIEPRSEEDLQAAVKDPAVASLGLVAQGVQLRLNLQAKTRSGSPWSTTAIANVLLGKNSEVSDQGKGRVRPLSMLEADPQSHYVFVSNEASASGLRPHEGLHLFDFPEVDRLPPYARAGYDAAEQASLAPRIVLLTGVTREVLGARISTLLAQHGHVPVSKHDECLRDLREAVRQRIMGAHGGRWTRTELIEVLAEHGGSVAPTRDMEHYVRPKSYEAIKAKLDTGHAVVIAGPSGTGKTLTADILELNLRGGQPPFDVIGEEHGPGYIRSNLTRADPVLFHLRDPWGGNRLTPGADRWSGELPKLLDNAAPGRKFLVTSRSDVLQSAGRELTKELESYIVSIEVEDYGDERLAEIYDGISADLTGRAKQLATQHRQRALSALARPYEVKRFLVALSREDGTKPRKVDQILADSQIEAISRVIADQIGADGAEAAAAIWAMLSARGAVARDVFAKLGRRLRTADPNLRPDVDGLIDFLVAGQNLRQDGTALAFHHPRVEDGLRLAFMRRPRDAEHVLSNAVDVLMAWDQSGEDWGLETGLNVLRASAKVEGLELGLSQPTAQRLDQHLEAVALSAEKRADFEGALRDLAVFGSEDHPPARLARILIEGGPEVAGVAFRERWRAPPLSEGDISALRNDCRTRPIIERFIREVLPFSQRDYHLELIPLLGGLAPGFADAFWDALDSIAGPGGPHENIDVIVKGALTGDTPDYERAIERFARSEADADAWMKGFADELYQAEEHVVDADAADHIIDEPGERYFNAREGLKMVVRLRRQREGVAWIVGHPHQSSLLHALAEQIGDSSQSQPTAELKLLLANGDDWVRQHAWSAAARHWDVSLSDLLIDELTRSDIDSASLRRQLIEIAAAHGDGDPVPDLVFASAHVTFARRLELLYDLITTKLDDNQKAEDGAAQRRARATRLSESFAENERELAKALLEVLAGGEIRTAASGLCESTRQLLIGTLASASIDLAGPLACLAAGAGVTVDAAATRLLSTDDAADGDAAIRALVIAHGADLRTKLQPALKHRRYPVRRRAFRLLATDATLEERADLIAVADDQSADVRLAFAEAMKEYQWPEAINALVKLLSDQRNFASHAGAGSNWSKYSVARAAAHSLEAYQVLPIEVIDALLETAQADGPDPFVGCAAVSALAGQDDPRIAPALLAALASPGLDRSPTHRPLAQAAAWAIFDRAISDRTDVLIAEAVEVAKRAAAPIAGPILAAFSVHAGDEREALLKHFKASGQLDREALMRTAAIVADRVEGLSLDDREKVLLRLARGETPNALSSEDLSAATTWSQSLDVRFGFERFTSWMVEIAFKLPLRGEVGDIRAYDLPERVGVMTMRSLTPFAEEGGTQPDDGY